MRMIPTQIHTPFKYQLESLFIVKHYTWITNYNKLRIFACIDFQLVSFFSEASSIYPLNSITFGDLYRAGDEAQSKPIKVLKQFQHNNMTPANNACKPSTSHSNSVSAPLSGLRGLNYTTVAVYSDTHRSDVPASAVSSGIHIATTTDTSAPAVNIITFAWSNSLIIKTVCDRTRVEMLSAANTRKEMGFRCRRRGSFRIQLQFSGSYRL